jgi:hypothetical protein
MEQIVSDIVSCENQIHQFFLNQRIGWSHCVRTLTVAPTERDVAGNASARQPMSLWRCRHHRNDQGTAPIPDRPVSQRSTANLRGKVVTRMAK